jgi:hypothetical protein
MLLVYLLKWLGIIDPKHTVVRRGVINFAVYSIAGLLLFIIVIFVGSYLGLIH